MEEGGYYNGQFIKTETSKDPQAEGWLTSRQAATFLGVSIRRVLQLIYDKRVEAKKIGFKIWMIEKESLATYARERKRRTV